MKNRTETGQCIFRQKVRRKAKLPKTNQDFWLARLRKRTYRTADAETEVEIPTWQVRLFHAGREVGSISARPIKSPLPSRQGIFICV